MCEGVNRPDYMVPMHLKERVIDVANKPELGQGIVIELQLHERSLSFHKSED